MSSANSRIKKHVESLEQKTKDQQGTINQLLEALEDIKEYWNKDNNSSAMEDACWRVIEIAEEAIKEAEK